MSSSAGPLNLQFFAARLMYLSIGISKISATVGHYSLAITISRQFHRYLTDDYCIACNSNASNFQISSKTLVARSAYQKSNNTNQDSTCLTALDSVYYNHHYPTWIQDIDSSDRVDVVLQYQLPLEQYLLLDKYSEA